MLGRRSRVEGNDDAEATVSGRPPGVRSAAAPLEAGGVDAAPVVDSLGRCVGLFITSDSLRWVGQTVSGDLLNPDGQGESPSEAAGEVRYHMTRRFGVASAQADVQEILHRLNAIPDPFLVVLDRQGRPLGVVRGIDVPGAVEDSAHADSVPSPPPEDTSKCNEYVLSGQDATP